MENGSESTCRGAGGRRVEGREVPLGTRNLSSSEHRVAAGRGRPWCAGRWPPSGAAVGRMAWPAVPFGAWGHGGRGWTRSPWSLRPAALSRARSRVPAGATGVTLSPAGGQLRTEICGEPTHYPLPVPTRLPGKGHPVSGRHRRRAHFLCAPPPCGVAPVGAPFPRSPRTPRRRGRDPADVCLNRGL